MLERAHYTKLDFVEYFGAFTQTRDEWIEQFVSRPKRLAILEAFATNRAILGRAVFCIRDETPGLSAFSSLTNVLKQSARRYDLPKEDPRHIEVSADVKREYAELLPDASVKGSKDDFWYGEMRSPGFISKYGDTEKSWRDIRYDDERLYVEYWKVANRESTTLC